MYEEGASIREVAEEVGLSQTATRYRLLRGNTKLRAKNGKVKPDVSRDRPR